MCQLVGQSVYQGLTLLQVLVQVLCRCWKTNQTSASRSHGLTRWENKHADKCKCMHINQIVWGIDKCYEENKSNRIEVAEERNNFNSGHQGRYLWRMTFEKKTAVWRPNWGAFQDLDGMKWAAWEARKKAACWRAMSKGARGGEGFWRGKQDVIALGLSAVVRSLVLL